jgi:hypothetical protein
VGMREGGIDKKMKIQEQMNKKRRKKYMRKEKEKIGTERVYD